MRQSLAKARDLVEEEAQRKRESSPTYQKWLKEQERAEKFQEEEETRLAAERQAQWLKVEEEAQKQWQELQKKLELAREEQERQNAKIRLEWEREQKRLRELKELKEKEAEEKRLEQEKFREEIENFVVIGGSTPEHLKKTLETNPGKEPCPFFKKTAACRFRDSCSRNHVRPGVSRILLIPNFYSHISLTQTENEHGSDADLEFESEDLYNDYHEFFYDVVPELETYGRVIRFKTCCNHEPHLRGNVYVEYSQTREAMKCYLSLNGRYYGGKQLNVEFCRLRNWKSAICGLYFKKKCPKGTACNFLHVFNNPDNLFLHVEKSNDRIQESSDTRQNWRWDSPDRENDSSEELHTYKIKSGSSKYNSSPVYTNGSSYKRSRSRSNSRQKSFRRSRSRSSKRSRSRSPKRRRKHRSRSHETKRERSRNKSISRHKGSRKHSQKSSSKRY